eukprot:s1861_g8.t1
MLDSPMQRLHEDLHSMPEEHLPPTSPVVQPSPWLAVLLQPSLVTAWMHCIVLSYLPPRQRRLECRTKIPRICYGWSKNSECSLLRGGGRVGYSRECPRSLRVSEVPRCRQEVQNGADIVDARWMGAQAVLVEESCRRAMYAVAWPRMGAAARSSARARWSLSQDFVVVLLSTAEGSVMAGRFQSDGGVFVQTFAALRNAREPLEKSRPKSRARLVASAGCGSRSPLALPCTCPGQNRLDAKLPACQQTGRLLVELLLARELCSAPAEILSTKEFTVGRKAGRGNSEPSVAQTELHRVQNPFFSGRWTIFHVLHSLQAGRPCAAAVLMRVSMFSGNRLRVRKLLKRRNHRLVLAERLKHDCRVAFRTFRRYTDDGLEALSLVRGPVRACRQRGVHDPVQRQTDCPRRGPLRQI